MKRSTVRGLAAIGVVLVAACGGSTSNLGPQGGPDGGSSGQQACADAATAICGTVNGCSSLLLQLQYGDIATCQTRFQTACVRTLGASGTGFTPAMMEACAQKVATESCADVVSNNPPAECQAAVGELANGVACGDSSQCQSQYCNKGTDGTCGACGTRTGGTCHRNEDCAYGQLCLGATSTCVVPGAAGATCDTTHPCNQTLACKSGTCSAPDEVGGTCTPGDASNPFGTCDVLKGLICHPVSRMCVALGLAAADQPCGAINNGYTACSANGACSTTTKTCVAALADGASCAAGTHCMLPAACSGGVCKLPDPQSCH
jgi:hypothetical protein